MVNFTVPEDIRILRKSLRTFVEEEVQPLEAQFKEAFESPHALLCPDGRLQPRIQQAFDNVRRRSGALGYYGMHMPEAVGGGGVSRVGMLYAQKEVFSHGAGLNSAVLAGAEGPSPLLLQLPEKSQARYLHPLVRGEVTTCFALTEPEAGSDIKHLSTRAERKNGGYVLNGLKTFITNAPEADFAQVFAVTDPKTYRDTGYQGVTAFVVERDTPGYRVGAINRSLLEDGGQAELIFENCEVPAENVIGVEGQGFYAAMGWIGLGRLNLAAMSLGLAQFLLDRCVEYATQRTTFGKPLSKRQMIRAMLAESATELAAAEQLVLNAAWKVDQGQTAVQQCSMAKLFATNMLFRLADRAVQVHGGMGLMRELPIERIFRFARALRIVEGADEIQKETIAKGLGL